MKLSNQSYLDKAKANRDRLDEGYLYPLIYSPKAKAFVRVSTQDTRSFDIDRCIAYTTKDYKIKELFKFFNEYSISLNDLLLKGRWSREIIKGWFETTSPVKIPSEEDIREIVALFSAEEL